MNSPAGHRRPLSLAVWPLAPMVLGMVCGTCSVTACADRQASSEDETRLVGRPASDDSTQTESPPSSEGSTRAPERTPTSAAPPDPETDGASERRGTLWYRFELGTRHLDVTVRLLRPADRTTFFLPDERRNRRRISVGTARGPDGPVSFDTMPDDGRIDVDSDGLRWVEFDYRVTLEPAAAAGPRAPEHDGDRLLAFLPRILVVPSKRVVDEIRDIPVEVHAPAHWRLLATWPRLEQKSSRDDDSTTVHGFVARNLSVLRDAFVVAGADLALRRRGRGDDAIHIGFDTSLETAHEGLADSVTSILDAYRRRFGSTGPVAVYFQRQDGDGLRGTGKRGGFVVEVPASDPTGSQADLLVAHEALHLWNGHRLRPEADAEHATRWFKEGVTHYMALKFLHRTGRFSLERVREEIADSIFYYRRNPASGGGEASRLDRHRLPYDRGVLLALALDGALADCTDGARGLEHWLQRLLHGPDREYNHERLRAALGGVTSGACPRADRIWRRHVAGDRTIETNRLAESLGLHVLKGASADETRLLPVEDGGDAFRRLFRSPGAD